MPSNAETGRTGAGNPSPTAPFGRIELLAVVGTFGRSLGGGLDGLRRATFAVTGILGSRCCCFRVDSCGSLGQLGLGHRE